MTDIFVLGPAITFVIVGSICAGLYLVYWTIVLALKKQPSRALKWGLLGLPVLIVAVWLDSEWIVFAAIGIFVLFVVALPATGMFLVYRGIVSAVKRRFRRSLGQGLLGLSAILLAVWIVAYIWGYLEEFGQFSACAENLGRKMHSARWEYADSHPGESIPARWPGEGPEPMCMGSGKALPYVYLQAGKPDVNDSETWIAYCPHPHKRYWWVFWHPYGRGSRVVLYSSGRIDVLSEKEFQEQLKRQKNQTSDE